MYIKFIKLGNHLTLGQHSIRFELVALEKDLLASRDKQLKRDLGSANEASSHLPGICIGRMSTSLNEVSFPATPSTRLSTRDFMLLWGVIIVPIRCRDASSN